MVPYNLLVEQLNRSKRFELMYSAELDIDMYMYMSSWVLIFRTLNDSADEV